MSILSTLGTLQTPLLLLLVIFGPSLLPRLLAYFRPTAASSHPLPPPPPGPPVPTALKLVLTLHIIHSLHGLLVTPYELFIAHRLPVVSTAEKIRAALIYNHPQTTHSVVSPKLDAAVDHIVTKLATLDARLTYTRVGHEAFNTCLWCRSLGDYIVAAAPGIVAPYAAQAVLIGAMGSRWLGGEEASRRAARWRGAISWVLGLAAALDLGVRYMWDLSIVDGDCLHLSSTLHTARSLLLLVLPIIYLLLPIPSTSLPQIPLIQALSMTRTALQLASLSRIAASRSPTLYRSWLQGLSLRIAISDAARDDELVRGAATEVGRGPDADEGSKQRAKMEAKRWLEKEWASVVRLGRAGPAGPA